MIKETSNSNSSFLLDSDERKPTTIISNPRIQISGKTLQKVSSYGKLILQTLDKNILERNIQLGEKEFQLYQLFKENEKELGEFAQSYKNLFKGGKADPNQLAAALPKLIMPIIENLQNKHGENKITKEDGFEGLKNILGKIIGEGEVAGIEELAKDPSKILSDPNKTKSLLKNALDHMKGMKFNEAGNLIGETFLGNTTQITAMIDQLAESSPYLNKLWRIGSYALVGLVAISIVVEGILIKDSKTKAIGIIATIGGGLILDVILAIIDAIIYKKKVVQEQKTEAINKAFSEIQPAIKRMQKEKQESIDMRNKASTGENIYFETPNDAYITLTENK